MSGSDDTDDISRHNHHHHRRRLLRSNIPQEVKYPISKKTHELESTIVVGTSSETATSRLELSTTPDTLATSMNTLTTSTSPSTSHQSQPIVETSFEPLKIGLDSGDDSSVTSDVDDEYDFDDCDSDYFFGFTTTANNSNSSAEEEEHVNNNQATPTTPPLATFELFHKEPHKTKNENESTNNSNHLLMNDASTSSSTSSSSSSSSIPIHEEIQDPFNTSQSSSASSFTIQENTNNHNNNNKRAKFNHRHQYPKQQKRKNRVSLHKSVSVIHIPSRCEYPSIVRERLWSSSAELCANAARNSVEFASEGWNWRNVIEDEDMLLHQASGELIHPIHVHNALMPLPSHALQNKQNLQLQQQQQNDDTFAMSLLAGLVPNTQDHKKKIQSQKQQLLQQLQPSKDVTSEAVVTTATNATNASSGVVGVDVVHPPSIQVPIINTDPIVVADKN